MGGEWPNADHWPIATGSRGSWPVEAGGQYAGRCLVVGCAADSRWPLRILLTDAEREAMNQLASLTGLDTSTWARSVLLDLLSGIPKRRKQQ